MDLARVRREVADAQRYFEYVNCEPTEDGNLYVLVAIQTTQKTIYTLSIYFPDTYPNEMPKVYVRHPALRGGVNHRYKAGNICYLHPTMWNPGSHHLTFVIQRAAKWLAKYEVFLVTNSWPGKEILH